MSKSCSCEYPFFLSLLLYSKNIASAALNEHCLCAVVQHTEEHLLRRHTPSKVRRLPREAAWCYVLNFNCFFAAQALQFLRLIATDTCSFAWSLQTPLWHSANEISMSNIQAFKFITSTSPCLSFTCVPLVWKRHWSIIFLVCSINYPFIIKAPHLWEKMLVIATCWFGQVNVGSSCNINMCCWCYIFSRRLGKLENVQYRRQHHSEVPTLIHMKSIIWQHLLRPTSLFITWKDIHCVIKKVETWQCFRNFHCANLVRIWKQNEFCDVTGTKFKNNISTLILVYNIEHKMVKIMTIEFLKYNKSI